MIVIEEDFFPLLGLWTNLLIETLFLENIFVMFDKTPDLSITSNLKYEENNLLEILLNNNFFLSFVDKEKGN